jgi:FKBP12-rapamycin complex-associated protein
MYNIKGKNIKISSFYNELTVLQSKQRPRKLKIFGDDEKEYHFLLKGREDVRLDERVMQFLGLINKLLERESESIKKDLNITRY